MNLDFQEKAADAFTISFPSSVKFWNMKNLIIWIPFLWYELLWLFANICCNATKSSKYGKQLQIVNMFQNTEAVNSI